MTSCQSAGGPGSVRSWRRQATQATPNSGETATANPYGPAVLTPMAASTTHSTMRTTPSVPSTMA